MANEIVKYETSHGEVALSPDTVRKYLVNGNGNVTEQEVTMFLNLCKYQGLNPFLREAYLIKFNGQPATIVTGKEVFTKRAYAHPKYGGMEAGITVLTKKGELVRREGALVLDGEVLVAGWARVHIKENSVPIFSEASMTEYCRMKSDGTPMAQWKSMPATMIRKVAVVQALREAFPESFQGMYSQEEMPVDGSSLPETKVNMSAGSASGIEDDLLSDDDVLDFTLTFNGKSVAMHEILMREDAEATLKKVLPYITDDRHKAIIERAIVMAKAEPKDITEVDPAIYDGTPFEVKKNEAV